MAIHRRDFLRTLSVAGAALALPGATESLLAGTFARPATKVESQLEPRNENAVIMLKKLRAAP